MALANHYNWMEIIKRTFDYLNSRRYYVGDKAKKGESQNGCFDTHVRVRIRG